MDQEIYSPPRSRVEQNKSINIGENPHDLGKQIAGLVVASILVVVLFYLTGIPLVLIGIFTFLDAWNSGIYKNFEIKKLSNLSPMGWGIGMMGLLFIVYPLYLFNRKQLKTKDGPVVYWIFVNIFGVILLLLTLLQIWASI